VAGATSTRARVTAAAALVVVTAAAATAAWGWHPAVRGAVAVLAGLCAGDLLRRLARRRLGGMTGDAFGALIEVSSATVLLALALTA
jgi:adenosylcobinamide-GDP ribazoletransferase